MVRLAVWAARAAALVLVLALFANGDAGIPTPPPWDKVAHYGYFGLFTGTLWLASGGRARWPWLLAASLMLGIADEWRQLYLPHRQASVADLLADIAGAATALLVLNRAAALVRERSRDSRRRVNHGK